MKLTFVTDRDHHRKNIVNTITEELIYIRLREHCGRDKRVIIRAR